jgi:translation elongation factor EF-G
MEKYLEGEEISKLMKSKLLSVKQLWNLKFFPVLAGSASRTRVFK